MNDIEIGKIYWFIKRNDGRINVLGFMRGGRGIDCFIIGGATGSHCSGHDETWIDKWDGVIKQGYIPVEEAIKKGLLPAAWDPPKLSKDDELTMEGILKLGKSNR